MEPPPRDPSTAEHDRARLSGAGMLFDGTGTEWLVASGTTAATGTLDGRSGYAYTVTVVDAGEPSSTDRIRVMIWKVGTGAVVYDNGTSGTPLRSGNRQVHACRCGRRGRNRPAPPGAYAGGVRLPLGGGASVLRLLGLLLVVWLAFTLIGALVKGLFWLAVVGLLFFVVTAIFGWNKRNTRV